MLLLYISSFCHNSNSFHLYVYVLYNVCISNIFICIAGVCVNHLSTAYRRSILYGAGDTRYFTYYIH